jgi:DNA-binding XRE family transcriptional regulator
MCHWHNMVTNSQFRMARAALCWTVREAATQSGLHRNTIVRIEAGAVAEERTVATLRRTYESVGITFVDDVGAGYGVAYREPRAEGDIREPPGLG